MSENSGWVQSLQVNLHTRQPMQCQDRVMAVPGAGLLGCRHSKPGNDRAVLLLETETMQELGLVAGEIKENITTRGIQLRSLSPGSQLQLGDTVVLEITGPCPPCHRMEEIRAGLQAELQGRRGVNCRVVIGGPIEPGDAIKLIKPGRVLP
jgi:MOSC domain-containing protein YiiM